MQKFDFKQYVEDNMQFERSGENFHINCVDPDCDDNWKLGHHLYVLSGGEEASLLQVREELLSGRIHHARGGVLTHHGHEAGH